MAQKARVPLSVVDWQSFGLALVAGIDEAGRGCLAGPVYAAAVILSPENKFKGLTDSKLVTPERRFELALEIKSGAVAWAVGVSSVEEIENINILQASLLAMRRAALALSTIPELLLIDGDRGPGGAWPQMTFVKGDLRCLPISAASIIAKTERDIFMDSLHSFYPHYDFGSHKGYGTPAHKKAIVEFGPCPMHRRTFAGVKEYIGIRPPFVLAKTSSL